MARCQGDEKRNIENETSSRDKAGRKVTGGNVKKTKKTDRPEKLSETLRKGKYEEEKIIVLCEAAGFYESWKCLLTSCLSSGHSHSIRIYLSLVNAFMETATEASRLTTLLKCVLAQPINYDPT